MVWFKNAIVFRLNGRLTMTAEQLAQDLAKQTFTECGSSQMESVGWAPPRPGGSLVHQVNGNFLLSFNVEKKLLPAAVINKVTSARVDEVEEQQGYRPGKKQIKELKEAVTDELLPRAFTIAKQVHVWIDPRNRWFVIDTATASKADEVIKYLLKCCKMPIETLRVKTSPSSAMTTWLHSENPCDFSVDQETELTGTGEEKAKVRVSKESMDVEDVKKHVSAGKRCTKLAMTWNSKISFILTETLCLKRLVALDVLEDQGGQGEDAAERFDSDFAMMTGELEQLLAALIYVLDGEMEEAMAA